MFWSLLNTITPTQVVKLTTQHDDADEDAMAMAPCDKQGRWVNLKAPPGYTGCTCTLPLCIVPHSAVPPPAF